MSVVAFERKAWVVARGTEADAEYLRKVGGRYSWTKDKDQAEHFKTAEQAGALAGRVAGGAVIHEITLGE